MASASFRFYAQLNRLLAPERRGHASLWQGADDASAKHALEALGVPHTEVDLLLVNGEPAGFGRRLAEGDRVAVYPKFEALDLGPLPRLHLPPSVPPRFVADAHLGALARLLRMAGFDTVYDNGLHDDEIVRLAEAEERIVLSRDRELLKRRELARGAYLHELRPVRQLREVFERFDLETRSQPFSRCMQCNVRLRPADKSAVAPRLPPRVRERHERFCECPACGRLYWEGSHWRRMRALLDALLTPRSPAR
jgi:uncharacterized protein